MNKELIEYKEEELDEVLENWTPEEIEEVMVEVRKRMEIYL